MSAVAPSRPLYNSHGSAAAASLPHDAIPSMHLHRYVANPFFCSPAETNDPEKRPPVEACGLQPGQSWPAFYSYFSELQRSHSSRQTGIRFKTLYFLRHAEGLHNVAERTHGTRHWEAVEALKDEYTDPDLTEKGRGQCLALAKGLPAALAAGLAPQLVLCSPLRRTLQTAALSLEALPHDAAPWIVVEQVRETLHRHTCDRRHPITEEVEAMHPRVQFHLLRERHDALWVPLHRERDEDLLMRAQRVLDFLFDVPEEHIIIVAHGGMLSTLGWLIAKELQEGAAAASSSVSVPRATSIADVQAYLKADGAMDAVSIEARHCELQPFVVARLPLQTPAPAAASPEKSKL
jgi:broad specificity phosphatase PhoE